MISCGTPRPFYQSGEKEKPDSVKTKEVDYTVFLIGDTGEPVLNGTDYTLQALRSHLVQAGDSSTAVFLGDNIYSYGMNPDTSYQARKNAEAKITRTMESLINYSGNSFFIPGNHDWRYGIRGIRAEERFIENYEQADVELEPNNGCPGPTGFDMGKNWYLIMVDSEWFVNQSYKLNVDVEGCEQTSRIEVMNRVAELADEHDDKHILIAAHHPIFSNGTHAGYYPFRDHIFPLTHKVDNLYLPLPLIGSIYPIYRKLGRSPQDLNHQQYEEYIRQLRESVEDHDNVFFASGHEHSLAFYEKEKQDPDKEGTDFFILSGAGSKHSYARTGYGADFVYSHKGFAKLVSYKDGSVDLEFWTPNEKDREGELVYYKELIEPTLGRSEAEQIALRRKNYEGTEDTAKTVAAGPGYKAGKFHRFFWGDHYREAWTTKVDVPVFDLDTKKGGLKVLDVTGGEQTITIILQDSSQNRYVMRSVQKDPAKSLPDVLQETFVKDLTQDQISASHPYGASIVPPMANAAGVYQTSPEVGYVSKNSGIKMDVGDRDGAVVTFEEFVSKDWFNNKYNKDAVDIISSAELWERKKRGGKVQVDQKQLVRSRLFDMLIDDWDRHEGQWFWAETRNDSVSVFEPIPIDRDNAFFKGDGVFPWLGRRKWGLRKFQMFNDDIRDMPGMNFNARFFDRWFINELPRKEWMAIAEDMQKTLTDSVIERAINEWPQKIQEINGQTFIEKLKARRDKLTDFARRYYNILSEEVNVYGTDNADVFDVKRLEGGRVKVRLFETVGSGDDKRELLQFEREFVAGETKEIRLYGFGENDNFNIAGNVNKSITIRIIGGEGQDIINDQSSVDGWSKKTLVYDTGYGSSITSEGEVKSKISDDPRINRFDNRSFEYGFTAPLIAGGYNRDDGIFLGGGALIQTHGFRKEPFATQHRITAKHSLETSSFSIDYTGIYTDELDPFNLQLDAEVLAPRFVTNYFGIGNDTELERDDYDYYDYRMDNVDLEASITEGVENLLFFNAGIGYEYYKPLKTPNNFITSPDASLPDDVFNSHHFANVSTGFTVTTVDDPMLPHYGVEFNALGELNVGLNKRSESFGRVHSMMKFYYTLDKITTTLAMRLGVDTNIGDYDFFNANHLGGQRLFTAPGNLRGFARNRFAGRTSLYHNTELRTKLGNLKSYFLPAQVGISAFFDEGRVWADNLGSITWHYGYGGGIWMSPLNFFVMDASYAISEEDEFFSVTLGFSF